MSDTNEYKIFTSPLMDKEAMMPSFDRELNHFTDKHHEYIPYGKPELLTRGNRVIFMQPFVKHSSKLNDIFLEKFIKELELLPGSGSAFLQAKRSFDKQKKSQHGGGNNHFTRKMINRKQNKTKQNRKKYLKRIFGGFESSIVIFNTTTEENIQNINKILKELKQIYNNFKTEVFEKIEEITKIITDNQKSRININSDPTGALSRMQESNYEVLKDYQNEGKEILPKYTFLVYENGYDENNKKYYIKEPSIHDATFIPQIIDDLESIIKNEAAALNKIEIRKRGDHIQTEKDLKEIYTHYEVYEIQNEVDDNNKIIGFNEKLIQIYPNDENSIEQIKYNYLDKDNTKKYIIYGVIIDRTPM
jgi:hypothetical protein